MWHSENHRKHSYIINEKQILISQPLQKEELMTLPARFLSISCSPIEQYPLITVSQFPNSRVK